MEDISNAHPVGVSGLSLIVVVLIFNIVLSFYNNSLTKLLGFYSTVRSQYSNLVRGLILPFIFLLSFLSVRLLLLNAIFQEDKLVYTLFPYMCCAVIGSFFYNFIFNPFLEFALKY